MVVMWFQGDTETGGKWITQNLSGGCRESTAEEVELLQTLGEAPCFQKVECDCEEQPCSRCDGTGWADCGQCGSCEARGILGC